MFTEVHKRKSDKENKSVSNKDKTISIMSGTERRMLKTLQLSANGSLIGLEKHPAKSKITGSKKPVKIFEDKQDGVSVPLKCEVETQTLVEHTDMAAQTVVTGTAGVPVVSTNDLHNDSGVGSVDIDQEAYDLLVRDPIPESYWRELAEERRLSLVEALTENEILHQSMEELKEENNNLSLLAGQAEHLASVLNEVLGDDENKSGDSEVEASAAQSSDEVEDDTCSEPEESKTSKDTAENKPEENEANTS